MALTLSVEDFQDLGKLLTGRKAWWVNAAAANDSGDGKSPATAKKVIGSALALAASGDEIIIGAGSYAENFDASAKTLYYRGAGAYETVITSAASHTVISGAYSKFSGLSILNTKVLNVNGNDHGLGSAIYAPKPGIVVDDCFLNGTGNGISNDGITTVLDYSTAWRINRSTVSGAEYAIQSIGVDLLIRDSFIKSTYKTYRSSVTGCIQFGGSDSVDPPTYDVFGHILQIDNCHLHSRSNQDYLAGAYKAGIVMLGGNAKINNSAISVLGTGTETLYGIVIPVAGSGNIIMDGSTILTRSDNGGICRDYYNYESKGWAGNDNVSAFGAPLLSVRGKIDPAKLYLNGVPMEYFMDQKISDAAYWKH